MMTSTQAYGLLEEGDWADRMRGTTLHYRLWRPAQLRVLTVLIHGFGEHGGRYQEVAKVLTAHGIAVAAPDLPGHGRSSGARGEIGEVTRCVQSIQQLTAQVFLPWAGQPRYAVYGHSFGGLVAIHYGLARPQGLRRLVVQSPLLEPGFPIPKWKTALAAILGACLPQVALSMDLETNALSHDAAVVEAYRADALVHGVITAGSYQSILRARDEAFARTGELRTPLLLVCGSDDRIVSVEVARRWFRLLQGEKREVLFPGAYHELHHEAVRDELFRVVREWILADA